MQFNHFANIYNNNAFIQKDLINWGLPFINTIPLTNTTIIEFGAGTGLLTQHLLNLNPSKILASDISLNMITEGKKNAPHAHWKLMNAWNPISQTFDHIFSSSLLQWCPNPKQSIQNWSHSIPKGGTIHALFFIDQTLHEFRQFIPLNNTIQWKTAQSWTSLFKNAGLHILLSRESKKTYEFPSSLHLLKTLKHTGTSLKNHLCGGHLKQILKTYDKQFHSPNGILSTWQFCQLIVQKK